MKVVLISGPQGSGKTTLQKLLCEKYYKETGHGATFVNFADVIYEMHNAVLKVLHEYWPNRNLVKDGDLLQVLGTDWARKTIDENIWVKILKTKVEKMTRVSNLEPLVIIGDCRFPNEFDGFEHALRIRLECSEDVRKQRCSAWRENSGHSSETALDKYAEQRMFDLYLNTETTTADGCLSLAWVALEKNSWLERRK